MATSAEHAARPFLASAYRIRRFVREHALEDRPHTSLWLAKTYVNPAGMYGSQVWGTGFLQADREFSSPLSIFSRRVFLFRQEFSFSQSYWFFFLHSVRPLLRTV